MSDIDDIQRFAREAVNKRRYERFKANLQVRYQELGNTERNMLLKNAGYALSGAFMARAAETQDLQQMISEDLSVGGVRVMAPQPLKVGSELWVNLKLPSVPIPINALATVMWTKAAEKGPMFNSGLK